MNLGELLPEKLRDEYATRKIQIGSVIRMYVQDTNPPKEKRFVIVSEDETKVRLAVVYFNTVVNPNVNYTEESRSLHIPVSPEGRDYLSGDCFIDCSELLEKSKESVIEYITDNPGELLGHMSDDDQREVQVKIMQAKTIPPYKKRRYGFA
ncbi:hypothetical protein [Dyadobacter fermentans]|uniref:hypothetical protein n=1 Tax=Dyadobacter fermentans TaxID=94254 RepID=UPI001CBDA7B1|nr:hypothetical protein [Dyadobacter fermentans]MBZ1360036.1 hypothetical protein [Dyadobacter fermentans]